MKDAGKHDIAGVSPPVGSQQTDRLPCRGCMADCANYLLCDGRPWRLPAPVESA